MSNTKVSSQHKVLKIKKARVAQNIHKRNRNSTEKRLLKAGVEIFSKYGFDAATTKLISKKSNVNESLIMRYFGGKEGLLIEIIRRFLERSQNTPLSYPPQESLEAELVHFCRQSFEDIKRDTAVMRIMILRSAVDPKMKKKVSSLINSDGNPRLIERIQLLKDKNRLPAGFDPMLIHVIAFHNVSAIFISDILFEDNKQIEIEKNLEKIVSLTVKGIMKKS
jgi:AcrR family transcriptional regulator